MANNQLVRKVEHVEVKRKTNIPGWAKKFVIGKYLENNKTEYDSGLIVNYLVG